MENLLENFYLQLKNDFNSIIFILFKLFTLLIILIIGIRLSFFFLRCKFLNLKLASQWIIRLFDKPKE